MRDGRKKLARSVNEKLFNPNKRQDKKTKRSF